MKILALTKYDLLAASSRQRFKQYEPALAAAGISVDYAPFFGKDHMGRLVAGRRAPLWSVILAYAGRLRSLLSVGRYDALWIQYELFPYLPGLLERLAAVSGKPIIVDYDDAIFHMYDSSPNPLVRTLLGGKLTPLLRRAAACCCGNEYVRDYAAQYCPRTIVLPTVVDTDIYRPLPGHADGKPLVIGWIGSPSTWTNVRPLLPMLQALAEQQGIVVRAVGAGAAAEQDRFPGLELIEWSEASEVAAVQSFDIGIMPLQDRPFERGKSGYKLIQYMACGLPSMASPVGVNTDIVDEGVTGLLATSNEEWRMGLERLLADSEFRGSLGAAARRKAVSIYSLQAHAPRLVDVMEAAMEWSR